MKKYFVIQIGLTILEAIISITIFSLLLGLVFYIFSVSSASWRKVRQSVELKDSGQVLITRIEKEIRSTSVKSVEITHYPASSGNDSISFLSAYDNSGESTYNYIGNINWKAFVIFYLKDDPAVVCDGYYRLFSRKVLLGDYADNFDTNILSKLPYPPLVATDPNDVNPVEDYINGNVIPPFPYLEEERAITGNIRYLQFILYLKGLDIVVKIGKPLNPDDPLSEASPEKMEIKSTVFLRNK